MSNDFDHISPGFWYLTYGNPSEPMYTIVEVLILSFGPDVGKKVVYLIDEEGYDEIEQYNSEQFYKKVEEPWE